MPRANLPELIAGPYELPDYRYGEELAGEIVHGLSDAPIPWPFTRSRNGAHRLVLAGDLVAAVVAAVMAWWGVGRSTVQGWRRRLGITQFNAGTLARWRLLEDDKVTG